MGLAAMMQHVDERLRAGEIGPADHEAIWWQVYESLTRGQVGVADVDSTGSIR